jgi:hypothetical protein
MPNYHEVQRVLADPHSYAHLKEALHSALEEACRNEGHKMILKGFREEEHVDQATGRRTILVYAQFTPAFVNPLTPLNPSDLNDAATQNGENGIPRHSQLAKGEGIPADQRFGAGQTTDITQGTEDTAAGVGGALPLPLQS